MSQFQSIDNAEKEFQQALDHMKNEFSRLQVGRASSVLVENIPVDVYGGSQNVRAVASISIPDPRTIQIQPWDKALLTVIEKAIIGIGTGLNPQNDGNVIRINIPHLTEERRTDLKKHVGKLAEDAKISMRNSRHDVVKKFKVMKDEGEMTEDDVVLAEKKLQELVDKYNKFVDEMSRAKELDIMTV